MKGKKCKYIKIGRLKMKVLKKKRVGECIEGLGCVLSKALRVEGYVW